MRKKQKNEKKKILGPVAVKILFFMVGLFISVAVAGVYAAWNQKVFPGDTITANRWNEVVDKLTDLEGRVVMKGTTGCTWEGWLCACIADTGSNHEASAIFALYCSGTKLTNFKGVYITATASNTKCPEDLKGTKVVSGDPGEYCINSKNGF